jgi:hypothetical protein
MYKSRFCKRFVSSLVHKTSTRYLAIGEPSGLTEQYQLLEEEHLSEGLLRVAALPHQELVLTQQTSLFFEIHLKHPSCKKPRARRRRLTSHSLIESMASKSLPCLNLNRTISSACLKSSSSWIRSVDGPAQAFIICWRSKAYLPILWTGFSK